MRLASLGCIPEHNRIRSSSQFAATALRAALLFTRSSRAVVFAALHAEETWAQFCSRHSATCPRPRFDFGHNFAMSWRQVMLSAPSASAYPKSWAWTDAADNPDHTKRNSGTAHFDFDIASPQVCLPTRPRCDATRHPSLSQFEEEIPKNALLRNCSVGRSRRLRGADQQIDLIRRHRMWFMQRRVHRFSVSKFNHHECLLKWVHEPVLLGVHDDRQIYASSIRPSWPPKRFKTTTGNTGVDSGRAPATQVYAPGSFRRRRLRTSRRQRRGSSQLYGITESVGNRGSTMRSRLATRVEGGRQVHPRNRIPPENPGGRVRNPELTRSLSLNAN